MIDLQELIEKFKQVDILKIVMQKVDLETTDSIHYYGKCPFCDDTFYVNKETNYYYCFNCGSCGDVISFVMHFNKWNYLKTIEYFLEITESEITIEEVKESLTEDKSVELLNRINKDAATFYYVTLRSKEGRDGLKYYSKKRKLSKETMYKFGLGFAPGKDALYRHLKTIYTDEQLFNAGLIVRDEKENIIKDKFRYRVMVPIMDINGRVIAFGGRALGDWKPKYMNSSETQVFDKGKTLFALQFAKDSERDGFILCEGYMDVISMHQAGLDNTIASLGTALTEKHAQLIKNYRDTIYLAYDNDDAGKNATERNIPILRSVGIEPKVINMAPYKDPDEFIQALGVEEFEERIKTAVSANEFLLAHYHSKMQKEEDEVEKEKLMTKIALVLSKSI